jgi:phosphatidylglycerol:prolipoprotein diacylglycerol transferase
MHPIFFSIGPLTIRWYGVMAAVGFLLAALFLNLNRKRANMDENQASALLFLAIISGVVGSRVFYVIQYWSQFRDNFSEVFRIDHGGLVFYGGFFLAIAAMIIYCRAKKLDLVRVLDVFSPALAIGHAMGRIGCFLNGCCYGSTTGSWFGVHYPEGSAPALKYSGAALHPVQLYESCGNILLALFLLYLLRHAKRGVTLASYIVLYGVMRFVDEFFRGDHSYDQLWIGGLTPAQTIGLLLIPVGICTLIYFLRRHDDENDKTDDQQSK